MNCHTCGKYIDLEWDNKEDAQKFQDEMEAHGVIAVCVDCYIPEEVDEEADEIQFLKDKLHGQR